MKKDEFKEFSYQYYDFCNSLKWQLDSNNFNLQNPNNSKLFKHKPIEFNLETIDNYKNLAWYYDYIYTIINKTDSYKYPEIISEFISFVKNTEKCFLYNNDDSNTIYCKSDDINGTHIMYIQLDDYNIEYKLQDSPINIISDKKYGGALSFMNDDEPSKTVLFANIKIYRNFGENMTSEFKFIQGSSIDFDNAGDEILFNIINKIIRKVVLNTFNDILNNTICKISDMNEKILAEEVLTNAKLDVWRCRSK